MNVVSDNKVVVNVQGIRNVTWGENTSYGRSNGAFYVTVTYKGGHNIFYYQAESEARALFQKIRTAMDRAYATKVAMSPGGETTVTGDRTQDP